MIYGHRVYMKCRYMGIGIHIRVTDPLNRNNPICRCVNAFVTCQLSLFKQIVKLYCGTVNILCPHYVGRSPKLINFQPWRGIFLPFQPPWTYNQTLPQTIYFNFDTQRHGISSLTDYLVEIISPCCEARRWPRH